MAFWVVNPKIISEVTVKETEYGEERRFVAELTPETAHLSIYKTLPGTTGRPHGTDVLMQFESVKCMRALAKMLAEGADALEAVAKAKALAYIEDHMKLVERDTPEEQQRAYRAYRRMSRIDEIESGEF